MSKAAKRSTSLFVHIALFFATAVAGCQSESPTEIESVVTTSPGTIVISETPSDLNAPWFLLQPDQTVREGAGATTLEDMPPGNYRLVWGPMAGWYSPTPNPAQAVLASGGRISFVATYPEIEVKTGSIAVDAEPNEINAPWTMEGPSGFFFEGNGDLVLIGREPGEYTVTFGEVSNYLSAGIVQGTLVAGGRLDLGGIYVYQAPPTSGTIQVSVSPQSASWNLSGAGVDTTGTGNRTFADVTPGLYTIVWHDVNGWITPSPAEQTESLADDATVLFAVAYSRPGSPRITSVDPSAGSMEITGEFFGSHTMDVEWTGDWIEAQPDGTNPDTKPGWKHFLSGEGIRDHITSNKSWSGSKSVDVSVDQTLRPFSVESTWGFNHGDYNKIYASYWTYIEPLAHNLAIGSNYKTGLKAVYLSLTDHGAGAASSISAPLNATQLYQSFVKVDDSVASYAWGVWAWLDCPGVGSASLDVWANAVGVDYTLPPTYLRDRISRGQGNGADYEPYAPSPGRWSRVEIYADAGIPDVASGEIMHALIDPVAATGRQIGSWATGVVLRTEQTNCRSYPNPWENFIFQYFFDDPTDATQANVERATFLLDDVYLQFGTRARVEIGEASVYELCTRLEVQPPTDWSDGVITIQTNRGAFAPGETVYVFVIRDDEEVSAGARVVLQ